MTQESLTIIMSIAGAFLSLMLVVNAFFVRQLVSSISEVTLGLAVLVEKHNGTSDRIKISELHLEKIDNELVSVRKRLHSLGNSFNSMNMRMELTCESMGKSKGGC